MELVTLDSIVHDASGVIARKIKTVLASGCKRVLLVDVPQVAEGDFELAMAQAGRNMCYPPYGLGLLHQGLGEAGYASRILDLNFEVLSRVEDINFHYTVWKEILTEALESFKPDLVAISCMFSMSHHSFTAVVSYVREQYPHLPTIVGGVHISGNTRPILERVVGIDFALKYEGDTAFIALLDYANGKGDESHLSQVAVIEDGTYYELDARSTPTGTALNRSPDYGDLPIGQYSSYGRIGAFSWLRLDEPRVGTILGNRGCRAKCTFCSVEAFNGKGVRSRTTDRVVNEIQFLSEHHGVKHFMWLDDDLFVPSAVGLFNEISRRNLNITWDATNGVIASATTEEMLAAASESGCIGLAFGIESGDPPILREVKKPSGVRHFRAVGEMLKVHPHIFSKGNLMIGFPGETVEQIRRTADLAIEIGLDWYTITSVSFLGGTEMTRRQIRSGALNESDVLYANFFVSPNGVRHKKEMAEKNQSAFSPHLFDQGDLSRIPSSGEISDLWFLMDYLCNFKPTLSETRRTKLEMKRLMCLDICKRVKGHAMAKLFLGLINERLDNQEEASLNFTETKASLETSAFWKVRFEQLGMDTLLSSRM